MSNSHNQAAVERVSMAFMATKFHAIDTVGFSQRLVTVLTEERNKVDNLPSDASDKAMTLCLEASKDLRRALQKLEVAHKRLVGVANSIGVVEAYGPDCVSQAVASANKIAA